MYLRFFLTLSLFSSVLAGCSSPEGDAQPIPLTKRFGDGGQQSATSLAVDASSSTIALTGSFTNQIDLGGGVLKSAGAEDLFVGALAADGVPLWSGRTGSDGPQVGTGVAFDKNGDVVLAASFVGEIRFGGDLRKSNRPNAVIVRFDPSGKPRVDRQLGDGTSFVGVGGLALDPLGDAIVGGTFSDSVNLGGETLTSDNQSSFIAKYDSQGRHVFSVGFGGTYNWVNAVATDPTGAILAVGQGSGTIELGDASFQSSNTSGFVAKLDPAGRPLWLGLLGITDYSDAKAVATSPTGDVVMVGRFSGTVTFGDTTVSSGGDEDAYVAKLSANGKPLWFRHFGEGGLYSMANSVAVGADGHVFFTGSYAGDIDFGGGPLPSANGFSRVYVVELDGDGNHVASRAATNTGMSPFSMGTAIALDPAGGVLLAGAFAGELALEGPTLTAQAGQDVFLVRLPW